MSYYAYAAGKVASDLMSLMDDSGEQAAFNKAYDEFMASATAQKNALNRINVSELNITQLRKEKLLSDNIIRMKQDEAEAAIKVGAAHAGIEGSTVGQTVVQTEMNKGMMLSENRKRAAFTEEGYLEDIKTLRYTAESAPKVRKLNRVNPWLRVIADTAPLIGAKEFGDAVGTYWDKGSSLWSDTNGDGGVSQEVGGGGNT